MEEKGPLKAANSTGALQFPAATICYVFGAANQKCRTRLDCLRYVYFMSTVEPIIELALRLTPKKRARLASQLLESLNIADEHEDIEAAWEQEVACRIRDILAGRAVTVPADEALCEARARLMDRR